MLRKPKPNRDYVVLRYLHGERMLNIYQTLLKEYGSTIWSNEFHADIENLKQALDESRP